MALTDKLTAIGDAIREKTGTTDLLTLDQMATAISGITGGDGGSLNDFIPEEAFSIDTISTQYKFAFGGWDWFIEKYGDRITTNNILNASYMFQNSKISKILFDINLYTTAPSCANIFKGCENLLTLPYIKGIPSDMSGAFEQCYCLKEIPEDWADHIDWSQLHTSSTAKMTNFCNGCNSLKEIPQNLIDNYYGVQTSPYGAPYYASFVNCHVLNEVRSFPVHQTTMTSNMFLYNLNYLSRLKGFTFATQEDGSPYSANWKSQAIVLTSYIGYTYLANGNQALDILSKSDVHGITEATRVTDDESYAALKDDPDWWTSDISYSRYNHDSAVATINSLPDTSAYLAEKGGTNTIKFKGESGSATDGGAINTLTEEEIAVATAKGWTVTLV